MQQNPNISAPQIHCGPVPFRPTRPHVQIPNVAPSQRPPTQVPMQQLQQHAVHLDVPPSIPRNQPSFLHPRRDSTTRYDPAQGNVHVPPGYTHQSATVAMMQSQVPVEQTHYPPRPNMIPANLRPPVATMIDLRQSAPGSFAPAALIQASHATPNPGSAHQNPRSNASHQATRGQGQPSASNQTTGYHRDSHFAAPANGSMLAQDTVHNQDNIIVQQHNSSSQLAPNPRQPGKVPCEQGLQRPTVSEFTLGAADRHVSGLIARSIPSLNAFLQAQKTILRDEFLRLNETHQQTLNKLKAEHYRASHAVHEASEAKVKRENAIRASEAIISNALKWKESLEDTRRKYSILQTENARLGRIALELNNRLKEESSEALVPALMARVQFLENRLKKYENVHTAFSDAEVPDAVKCEVDPDSSSSTLFSSPERTLHGFGDGGLEADKQRLQKIVVDLFERNVECKTAVNARPTKPMMVDAPPNVSKAPYIIDLTANDSGHDHRKETSLNQTYSVPTEATHDQGIDLALSMKLSPESASFLDTLIAPGDAPKRVLESDGAVDRSRKRSRPNGCVQPQTMPDSETTGAMQNLALAQPAEEDNDGWATVFACSDKLVGGCSNGLDIGKDDAPDPDKDAQGTDQSAASQEAPPQLDSVHLQLIYHKTQTGASECRFCVMENDLNCRGTDEKRIFSAEATNDQLIGHALSDHISIVSHMLKLDRSEILDAFAKIMAS